MMQRKFDLNIEKILENWEVHDAVREIIANAIDEQHISHTKSIEISKDSQNRWHIRDFGRGIRYEHLTQNENEEKLNAQGTIGKFGIGLKDALATFDRRGVQVSLKSKYGEITIGKSSKQNFSDLVTLHAYISDPTEPGFLGTDVVLSNVADDEIHNAKNLFLVFSGETILEETPYGQVLSKKGPPARIYINGVRVAEEGNFLFSYNITSLTAAIRKAMNRERSNVGRTAYADRVKTILLSCSKWEVANALITDLKNFSYGQKHDELNWIDVQQHAATILNKAENVVFVTPGEIEKAADIIEEAKETGHTLVVIPEVLKEKVTGTTSANTAFVTAKDIEQNPHLVEDLKENKQSVIIVPDAVKQTAQQIERTVGQEVRDFTQYVAKREENFEFSFVQPSQLLPAERAVFDLQSRVFALIRGRPAPVREILISETMQRDNYTYRPANGLWLPSQGRIVIKRSVLTSRAEFVATLLHETAHAISRAPDASRAFEDELTRLLGIIGSKSLEN